jgi:glutamate/aspartate transport system substrate-binding protein
MKRSLICLVLAVIIPSPVLGQELHGTLKKIKETKTIALGYREASHPFSYLGDDKKPAGYSVDLCTRIATDIRQQLWLPDLQIKWVPVVPENRIPLVVDGTIDIECGSTTNTLSRQEEVDFSYMIFVDGSSLLVTVASGIQTGSDLQGKRLALIPGTTTEKAVAEWLQKNYVTPQILKVKDHAEGLAALENGTADAYASDFTLLIGLGRTAKDPTKLTLFGQFFSYEPYGLMLRRDDSAFRLAVNRVLARLYRSGQILDIYKRWFGSIGRPSDMLMAVYALQSLQD